MSTPAIYVRENSHFKNRYAVSTGYSYMSKGLSDALDVFCAIIGKTPAQLGLFQGSNNPNEPASSANTHRKANAADLVLPVASDINHWITVLSRIGLAGWHRGPGYKFGNFDTPHIHLFALYMMNRSYVGTGIIDQQADYLAGRNGLVNNAPDYHANLRPDLKAVHFMGKAPSGNAVVALPTHSYSQGGKIAKHQIDERAKGFKITNAVGKVRVWKLDSHGKTIVGSSVDMLVTKDVRFYDLAKVKWA